MPKERNSRFFVLNELQELSKESDRLIEDFPETSLLDDWFCAIKETALKIKVCTSVKDIGDLPDLKSFLGKEQHVAKNKLTDMKKIQKEQVHAERNITTGAKTVKQSERSFKNVASNDKDSVFEETAPTFQKDNEKLSKSAVLKKHILSASTPKINIQNSYNKITPENSNCFSQQLMETPVMNRTFNKLINCTVLLDSTSCADKENSQNGKTNSYGIQTRSGSKRKSASKSESNKKQKTKVSDATVSISATKTSKSKQPLLKKVLKSTNRVASENKSKLLPVIVPKVSINKHNTSLIIAKEKQIMEEIQKKEEKANENLKKVLAERQLKAEENKKKRNEKMEKTLQKRLQMEKEKDIMNKRAQTKTDKESVKKPALKLRTKELNEEPTKEKSEVFIAPQQIEKTCVTFVKTPDKKLTQESERGKELTEQLIKEKSEVFAAPKQNEKTYDAVIKTPTSKLVEETESYELTPIPDSSTYDFSDEEDKPSGKPIPLWAQGVHLKSALIHQYYNPPNLNEIFGSYIQSPDLTEIFCIKKKQYLKRTSSAVWNSPPNRSFCH